MLIRALSVVVEEHTSALPFPPLGPVGLGLEPLAGDLEQRPADRRRLVGERAEPRIAEGELHCGSLPRGPLSARDGAGAADPCGPSSLLRPHAPPPGAAARRDGFAGCKRAVYRIGGAYIRPPCVQSLLRPRSKPSGFRFASKLSP